VTPAISLRIDLAPGRRLGPGKVALLEAIAEHGSISAGARAMKMSYKRAWDLVEEMNALFGAPLVAAQPGGRQGGGAKLTPAGRAVAQRFRKIEQAAAFAAGEELAALKAEIGGGA
jgi:molybdate transport system regulatory protein